MLKYIIFIGGGLFILIELSAHVPIKILPFLIGLPLAFVIFSKFFKETSPLNKPVPLPEEEKDQKPQDDDAFLVVKGLVVLFFILFVLLCVKKPTVIYQLMLFISHYFQGTLH